jgi:hypothetical protein
MDEVAGYFNKSYKAQTKVGVADYPSYFCLDACFVLGGNPSLTLILFPRTMSHINRNNARNRAPVESLNAHCSCVMVVFVAELIRI